MQNKNFKQTILQNVEMDTQTSFITNGDITIYPCNWEADITQIKEWGYAPSVDIEQGISNYHQWLRQENILA